MSAFADACHLPFSNGTEGDAWMEKWCRYCSRDHGQHTDEPGEADGGCHLILDAMLGNAWPEAWVPEPDDGRFFLPSRMICSAFTPCEPCGGDPGAEDRAERVAEVTAYWRERA